MRAEDDGAETVDPDLGAGMEGSKTDDNVVAREEEAIKLDGLNVAQVGNTLYGSKVDHWMALIADTLDLVI